jgi:glycosyltransferase involved in cell wall biosynthesis
VVEPIEQRYEVCVVGRCDFATGIGSVTYAACEMFGRNFPTCIFPTEPALRGQEHITLPNGRQIPVCKDPNAVRASLYCDVIWNGAGDYNYALLPKGGLKLATLVWDSDELPSEWISILNDHFDGVVCLSPHLVEMAQQSGVNGPFATVPLALDLEGLSSEPFAPLNKKLRVGCVAAFHPRKGIPILMEAFASLYAGRDDIELFLHSNLAFGGTVDRIKKLAATLGLTNIVVSTEALSVDAKNDLISSFGKVTLLEPERLLLWAKSSRSQKSEDIRI